MLKSMWKQFVSIHNYCITYTDVTQLVCENPLMFNAIHHDLMHATVDLQNVSGTVDK